MYIMKIFMPSKNIWTFSLWIIPFVILSLGVALIGYFNKLSSLLNVATVFLLLIILIFTIGSRIIRKDSIILTKEAITFASPNKENNYLKILLLQHEKTSILFLDVKVLALDESKKIIKLKTSNKTYDLNVSGFKKGQINKIMISIKERI